MTILSTRATFANKLKLGRAVLWFYVVTFLSVEIIRHMTNQ